MIDRKELRAGVSLVTIAENCPATFCATLKGKPLLVTDVTHFLKSNYPCVYLETLDGQSGVIISPEYIAPIALTEELLLKMGGERIGKTLFDKVVYKFKYKCYVWASGSNLYNAELIDRVGRSDYEAFGAPCYYLHSFQNLHFALTNTELTLPVSNTQQQTTNEQP